MRGEKNRMCKRQKDTHLVSVNRWLERYRNMNELNIMFEAFRFVCCRCFSLSLNMNDVLCLLKLYSQSVEGGTQMTLVSNRSLWNRTTAAAADVQKRISNVRNAINLNRKKEEKPLPIMRGRMRDLIKRTLLIKQIYFMLSVREHRNSNGFQCVPLTIH